MPRGDGTGPPGGGQGRGRGGQGQGRGNRSQPGTGIGPGGFCVCPSCGARAEHQPGLPCTQVDCPKCGTKMIRES